MTEPRVMLLKPRVVRVGTVAWVLYLLSHRDAIFGGSIRNLSKKRPDTG